EVRTLTIPQKFYSSYFESRSLMIYKEIKETLLKFLKDEKNIDIYSYWLYITARVAIELRKDIGENKNVSVFSRAHRYDLYEDEAPLKMLPQRENLLSNLDKIFPVSEDGKDFLMASYPQFKDKYKVQRLGTIDHGKIKP